MRIKETKGGPSRPLQLNDGMQMYVGWLTALAIMQ